jgi:hypothetical protein
MEVATIAFSLVTVRVRLVDCRRHEVCSAVHRSPPVCPVVARGTHRSPARLVWGDGRRSDKYGSPIEFRLAVIFSSITHELRAVRTLDE